MTPLEKYYAIGKFIQVGLNPNWARENRKASIKEWAALLSHSDARGGEALSNEIRSHRLAWNEEVLAQLEGALNNRGVFQQLYEKAFEREWKYVESQIANQLRPDLASATLKLLYYFAGECEHRFDDIFPNE